MGCVYNIKHRILVTKYTLKHCVDLPVLNVCENFMAFQVEGWYILIYKKDQINWRTESKTSVQWVIICFYTTHQVHILLMVKSVTVTLIDMWSGGFISQLSRWVWYSVETIGLPPSCITSISWHTVWLVWLPYQLLYSASCGPMPVQ